MNEQHIRASRGVRGGALRKWPDDCWILVLCVLWGQYTLCVLCMLRMYMGAPLCMSQGAVRCGDMRSRGCTRMMC